MNYFSKIKIGTWIVIILTLINLASLGTIIYKTSCHKHPRKFIQKDDRPGRGEGGFWYKLNLDTFQRTKFRELGKVYYDSMKVLWNDRKIIASQIADELKKETSDTTLIFSLCNEMGKNYTEQKRASVRHILDLKLQCRPEQLVKLDSMYYFLLIGPENPRRNKHRISKDSAKAD